MACPPQPILPRVEARISPEPNTGCWLWTGGTSGGGYPMMSVNGRVRIATRVIYEMHKGPLAPGMFVCHRCDTPACVNPDHLFAGSAFDNVRDMDCKGRRRVRAVCGEAQGLAKLTDADVTEIKRLLGRGGMRHRDIARRYRVSRSTVTNIHRNKVWRHVAAGE